jgi:hypothetical protein
MSQHLTLQKVPKHASRLAEPSGLYLLLTHLFKSGRILTHCKSGSTCVWCREGTLVTLTLIATLTPAQVACRWGTL